ncbi:nickel-dependent lactate racemase [Sporomusa sphaeroides]|uniref:nickel-dependent lactate racemase n=1 Tax=Sporomusa sphaeroides TaxID=47679 RepID=UPI00315823BD
MKCQMKLIEVPYGNETVRASVSADSVIFNGTMPECSPLADLEAVVLARLDCPTGCKPLKELVSQSDKIMILVEDNTRQTPVKRILPVLINYLEQHGVKAGQIEILIATGTHRIMTEEEIIEKVGLDVFRKLRIYQHDCTEKNDIADLGTVAVGPNKIPVQVNKRALAVDFILGLGNIVPHCDAGYSGGGKIVQPGICGIATTASTHITGALLEEIPLGDAENPCRLGIEKVAERVGLRFIINTVMNANQEVVDVVAGDFVTAHREGAKIAAKVYGVDIPALADITIVSSHPCNIDYWQAMKGLVAAYFTVKNGGYIIFVSPCYEGLEHNHPKLREWLKYSYKEGCGVARHTVLADESSDLVAADIAICNARIREKANILIVSDGLSQEDIGVLGYAKFDTLQAAVDYVLQKIPNGKIGVLPRGGDCLPIRR